MGDDFIIWRVNKDTDEAGYMGKRLVIKTDQERPILKVVDEIAKAGAEFGLGTVLGRSNVYTYRTPEYMLRYEVFLEAKVTIIAIIVQFRIFMVARLQGRNMHGNSL